MNRVFLSTALARMLCIGALCAAYDVEAADDAASARAMAVIHCSQCHTFDRGEPHGQGPNLWGLVGREAGAAPGYRYSEGFMAALKGKIWDTALLERWLTDTLAVAPGTQMIYWQEDPAKRATLIRFFESQR